MIDIHTHLLPEFDDGPKDLDETRKMLALAEKDGTTEVVLTSHILNPSDHEREDEILEKFELVKQASRKDGRSLEIYLGGEIYVHPETKLDRVFSTLNNNKKYALVEFGMRQIPEFVPKRLFDWLMEGYKPIIAHPERVLPIMKNPSYAYKFVQMGAALQLNAGSLLGVFGDSAKKCAHELIEHKLVHFIASDGHDTNSRSISLRKVYQSMVSKYGEPLVQTLMEDNPKRAIRGEELIREEPIPFEEDEVRPTRWKALKRKLRFLREP
ncbi:MAG: CpsB/CapC family capsule biosynthesis tyrosine phosphatase [bacterium]